MAYISPFLIPSLKWFTGLVFLLASLPIQKNLAQLGEGLASCEEESCDHKTEWFVALIGTCEIWGKTLAPSRSGGKNKVKVNIYIYLYIQCGVKHDIVGHSKMIGWWDHPDDLTVRILRFFYTFKGLFGGYSIHTDNHCHIYITMVKKEEAELITIWSSKQGVDWW